MQPAHHWNQGEFVTLATHDWTSLKVKVSLKQMNTEVFTQSIEIKAW